VKRSRLISSWVWLDNHLIWLRHLTLLLGLDALIAHLEVECASALQIFGGSYDTATVRFVDCVLVLAVCASSDLEEKASLLVVSFVPEEFVVGGIFHIFPFKSDMV
jgi:hypothetical protein